MLIPVPAFLRCLLLGLMLASLIALADGVACHELQRATSEMALPWLARPMSSRAGQISGLALLLTFTGVGPASALAAEPADLPTLERAWHGCVRDVYNS